MCLNLVNVVLNQAPVWSYFRVLFSLPTFAYVNRSIVLHGRHFQLLATAKCRFENFDIGVSSVLVINLVVADYNNEF